MVLKADEGKNEKQEKRVAEDGEEGERDTHTYIGQNQSKTEHN